MNSMPTTSRDTLRQQQAQADPLIDEVVAGLSQQQKRLAPKFFYDSTGSALFDQICALPEYYPYRTEMALLQTVARDVSHLLTEERDIVEFGAGSLVKIRLLLQHIAAIRRVLPIDIAGAHLRQAAQRLQKSFPHLHIEPIEADFTQAVTLPDHGRVKKLGFFPGSTIGNFTSELAVKFLRQASQSLGDGALLLVGVDTKKQPSLLHRAYNDAQGVTAEFNRNILTHINRVTDADFDPDSFDHYAFYNPAKDRVEMHLISQHKQTVNVQGNSFEFRAGESIHTEDSHKYAPAEFLQLAAQAGWHGVRTWLDPHKMFSMHLLRGSA